MRDAFSRGGGRAAPFFEGWYFKQSSGKTVCALIPGASADSEGRKQAFLQVISSKGSHFLRYPFGALSIDPERRRIRLGDSLFSEAGVRLAATGDSVELVGELRYTDPTPLRRTLYSPGAMGPFSYLPFLECSHEVLSLAHGVSGFLCLNGEEMRFENGTGYIEKDSGRSFPRAWVWYQSGNFARPGDCVMFAAATVPFLGTFFPGVICVCRTQGKEYRLATYYGAKLMKLEEKDGLFFIGVRQGAYSLGIRVEPVRSLALSAPVLGDMSRTIREYPCCRSRVKLEKGGETLLEGEGDCAGFERAGRLRV